MVGGKCIYCKEDKVLNKEHAFPQFLLHKCVPLGKCAPEWIIERLCENCNNKALGKLDKILATKSPMAFIWRRVKNEWESNKTDKKNESQAFSFYYAKDYGMNPVRLFYPDPLYGNLIVLHEDTGTSVLDFYPTPVVRAQAPQMILTLYAEGQTGEKVIAENCEKWEAGEAHITESDEHEGVYCIFGNTYIFSPEAVKFFTENLDREQEFKSEFLKKHAPIGYDLYIVSSENPGGLGKIKGFSKRFNASTKEQAEAQQFESKVFTRKIMILPDQKARPYIDRALAKIAFHCFLYHHPQFSGHEPIFDDVKAFVAGKDDSHLEDKQFTTRIEGTENYVWDSNEHYHIFRFYINGDNIVCQIAFFTGILAGPYASAITLAGDRDKAIQSPCREELMPFYVHAKSQLMRRILLWS